MSSRQAWQDEPGPTRVWRMPAGEPRRPELWTSLFLEDVFDLGTEGQELLRVHRAGCGAIEAGMHPPHSSIPSQKDGCGIGGEAGQLGKGGGSRFDVVDAAQCERERNPMARAIAAHQGGVHRAVARDFIRDANDLETAVMKFPPEADQFRGGLLAGRAPGAEDVNQHHLATESCIRAAHHPAIHTRKRKAEWCTGVRLGEAGRCTQVRTSRTPHRNKRCLGAEAGVKRSTQRVAREMCSDQVDKRAVEMTHDDTVALHAPAENAVIAGIGDDRALEAMRALLKEQHAWTGSCGLNEGCIP